MSRADLAAILLYASLYVLSTSILLFLNMKTLFSILPFSLPLIALNILVYFLTRRYVPESHVLKNKAYAFPVFLLSLTLYYVVNMPEFGGEWHLNSLVSKLLFLFALPAVYLLVAERSYLGYLFRIREAGLESKVTLSTTLLVVVPTFLYNVSTWKPVLSGEIPVKNLILAFPVALLYYFFLAALPEEFCFRAFLQENLAQLSNSRSFGLVSSALIFGLLHVISVRGWYNISIYEALARALLIQSVIGLVFGYIWEKTRSLISILTIHTLIDVITNITLIAQRLYGF